MTTRIDIEVTGILQYPDVVVREATFGLLAGTEDAQAALVDAIVVNVDPFRGGYAKSMEKVAEPGSSAAVEGHVGPTVPYAGVLEDDWPQGKWASAKGLAASGWIGEKLGIGEGETELGIAYAIVATWHRDGREGKHPVARGLDAASDEITRAYERAGEDIAGRLSR